MSLTAHDRTIDVNGVRLHYRHWENTGARPLLLLHASGCHAHWWDEVGPALANTYDVIALDLRGHGDSSHPEPPDYRFEAYLADIAGLVAALGWHDFDLVGHSMGGYLGLSYASTQPSTLRAVVAADILCEVDGKTLERMRQASTRPQPTFTTFDEAVQHFRLQPSQTTAAPEVMQALAREAVCRTDDGQWTFKFDRRTMALPVIRVWDLLPQITCPVLVVRGELSPLMPPENAERLAQGLAHGEWTTVSGAYHNVMLDNCDGFVQIVREFFGRVADG